MDFIGIVRKSFQMVVRHRVLWVLGLLASCAGGGGGFQGSFNFPSSSGARSSGGGTTPTVPSPFTGDDFQSFVRTLQQNATTIWIAIAAVICVLLLISVLMWIIGVIGRGSLVAAAQQIDDNGSTTFRLAWGAASKHARSLLGMNIVLFGPTLVGGLIILAAVAIMLFTTVLPAVTASRSPAFETLIAPILGVVCVIGILALAIALYGIFATIARVFAERAIILEGTGAIAGIKRGWAVFRKRLGDSIVLGLIMIVISVVVSIILGFAIVAVLVGMVAGGMTAGIFSGITTDSARALGSLAPGLILAVAVSICGLSLVAIVVEAFMNAWNSVAWTQAYRRFIA